MLRHLARFSPLILIAALLVPSAPLAAQTGGVVNAVTKSGGNPFSGSFRSTITNDSWRTMSPFDEPKTDATVPTYEATLGGPIFRDRTWFFGAGRMFDANVSAQTGYTNLPYQVETKEQRYDGKITQNIANGHSVRASYTGINRETPTRSTRRC